ncbi:MAG: acetate kinase [Oscillospiraceae bacterium]|jgi:acetate kinase|nr:acetate kinase [Oscillospiraceae bacterium]
MRILVINAGSSSLKYQLFDTSGGGEVLAKGLCERIGLDGHIKHSAANREPYESDAPMENHAEAVRAVIGLLTGPETGVIADMGEIGAIGHRVVHGGEYFNASVLVNDEVISAIEECVPLAPLHNPPNLVGIRACAEVMPGVPQAAVFDTAFHQTMPEKAYLYALPYEYYERLKIRRYGFHGTSHLYVARRAAEILGRPAEELKIITCHMGNGSSLAAVDGGVSVDTSMGFTPLEGVLMGTRSGSIDPAIIQYLMTKEDLTVVQVTEILNKKSGALGISGVSSDFRDLLAASVGGNSRARAALEIFAYSVKKTIGAYAAAMSGCDALVFTGGIGENHVVIRGLICEGLSYMGLVLDGKKNKAVQGEEGFISEDGSPNKIMVVPTNEELVIALDTQALVSP